jgi:hypothetical protein
MAVRGSRFSGAEVRDGFIRGLSHAHDLRSVYAKSRKPVAPEGFRRETDRRVLFDFGDLFRG